MEEKGRGAGAPPSNASAAITTSSKAAEAIFAEQEAPRKRLKRKANNSSGISSASAKRFAREKSFAPLPQFRNGPVTRARQSPNKFAAAAAAAASSAGSAVSATAVTPQNPSETVPLPRAYTDGEVTVFTQELNSVNEDLQAPLESVIDAEFEAIRSRDANAHVIPTPAAWFSWTKVHPIEERVLDSFFNGKSEKRTAQIYMEIRNLLMKKFHADPKTQIEPKDLEELSVGELDARQEVMEFLDHWGLINFHPILESDSAMDNANVDVSSKMASLVEKLYRFEEVKPRRRVGLKAYLSTPVPPRLLPESAVAEELRPEGPSVEYHCNSCSADCSRKRYHCQKQADFDLCSECYNNGKFDSGMSPADFIIMEPAEAPGVSGGSWTDQETLLLLEALELYGENWNEIAEHVATKTKAQCILHFVQMPIEDTFLEGKENFDSNPQGITDLGSTNNDSCPSKDAPETMENKSEANNNDSSTLNDTLETKENKISTNEQQSPSPKVNTSETKDASEVVEVAQEMNANCAINALKEAFQAVGALPGPGESFSFSEAGNPVMALAAYLVGLVEPDVAAASARSSLKAISQDTPGIQLAARHCFILEDPPDTRKEQPGSESADVEMVDKEVQKDESQKEEDHKSENQMSAMDGSDVSKDCTDVKVDDKVLKEKDLLVSQNDEKTENPNVAKESDDVDDKEDATSISVKKLIDSALPESAQPSTVKESSDLALQTEPTPSSAKESGDLAVEEISQCSVIKEVVDMVSDSVPPIGKDPPQIIASDSVPPKEKDPPQTIASDSVPPKEKDPPQTIAPDSVPPKEKDPDSVPPKEKDPPQTISSDSVPPKEKDPPQTISSDSVPPKEKDPTQTISSDSVPPKEKDPLQTIASKSIVETGANTVEDGSRDENHKSNESCNLSETRDDHNIDRVKRAAVATLSAAAVKAKLLANREEDQIQQLATFLIEKQLHKLETKLAFFNEMEYMIKRVREQMDRSRQRLYHERAQIIAARLGLPASSSRAMQPSLPTNRVAMSYANSMPRSLPSMNSQKPPIKTMTKTSAPPPSTSSISSTPQGGSIHPLRHDKFSSIGTN